METPGTSFFICPLCTSKKTYKSHSGLQHHETLKHSNYNIPPSHILPVPEYELSHLKKVMIREVGKWLKNHNSAVGEQLFSIHCSEHAFVGIFGKYIEQYSPCGNFYQCRFKETESYNKLAEILKDKQWGECDYGQGQISWVQLVSDNKEQDNQNCINQNNQYYENNRKKRAHKNQIELFIECKIKGFKDEAKHDCFAGNVSFHFVTNNAMFG